MQIVGHRGAAGLAPENTIAAFEKALKAKVDMIEFDVVVTSDHVPIVCHDPFIKSSRKTCRVESSKLSNLKKEKADLVTLKEALDFIDGRVKVFLEVKPQTDIEPIIKVLKSQVKRYGSNKLFLASFEQKILVKLHKALPDLPTIVLESVSSARAMLRARQLKTRNIALNKSWLWSGFIKSASKRGWKLYAYTINDPVKAKRLVDFGLYGVITDYPNRFKASIKLH